MNELRPLRRDLLLPSVLLKGFYFYFNISSMPQVFFLVYPPLGTSFYSSFPRHRKDKRPIPNIFFKKTLF